MDILQKTSNLPQQIRRQILHGVHNNSTTLVEKILIYITQELHKPELYIKIEFSNKTEVVVSDYGPKSILIEVTITGGLGYVNLRYVTPKTPLTKKQIIRLYHYLMMHYKVNISFTRIKRDIQMYTPLQNMVVKKFIQSSLNDLSQPRWLRAAITTIDINNR